MSRRSTVTAALALAATTILVVAACGSSVSGSPEANPEAVASAIISELPTVPEVPTDLPIPDLPTDLSLPTNLSELTQLTDLLPTDLSIPTDFSIPENLGDCLTVGLAFAGFGLAAASAYLSGGPFDATSALQSLDQLAGLVPEDLADDIQVLRDAATEANGKSGVEAGELFGSEQATAATDNLSAWVESSCPSG